MSTAYYIYIYIDKTGFIIFNKLIILYYVLQTVQRCKGKPNWLSPTLLTLVILTLMLGWVPILNILLIIALITITMHYYISCGGKSGGKRGGKI